MAKTSFFRQPFGSQRVNWCQKMLKSARHHFYTTVPLIGEKLSLKKLLLVRSEILRLFVNTFTANDKDSRHNKENFSQQIQMILSQKPKLFSIFLIVLPQST